MPARPIRPSSATLSLASLVVLLSGCTPVANTLRSVANSLDPGSAASAPAPVAAAPAPDAAPVAGLLPVPEAKFRNDTPDMALKSHFDFVRRREVISHNKTLTRKSEDSIYAPEAANLYAGNVRRYYDIGSAITPSQFRPFFYGQREEILKLDNESETRVIATVRLKLDGPLSTKEDKRGAEHGKKLLEEGEEYRFVMTKTETGWAIENVLEYGYDHSTSSVKKGWFPIGELLNMDDSSVGNYPTVNALYGYHF